MADTLPVRSVLAEGMRVGDLSDLVLPLLSVDEFQSKVDKERAVVFGFYVHDQNAANDLNRFVQKSAVPILDTEVSPAPDQHGYYLVFVELLRNERMTHNVMALLEEVGPLADIETWRMRVRDTDGLLPATQEALDDVLPRQKRADENAIAQFLHHSDLTGLKFEPDDLMVLEAWKSQFRFVIKDFGDFSSILDQNNLTTAPIAVGLREAVTCNRLERCLGLGWSVQTLGRVHVLQRDGCPDALLLDRL